MVHLFHNQLARVKCGWPYNEHRPARGRPAGVTVLRGAGGRAGDARSERLLDGGAKAAVRT